MDITFDYLKVSKKTEKMSDAWQTVQSRRRQNAVAEPREFGNVAFGKRRQTRGGGGGDGGGGHSGGGCSGYGGGYSSRVTDSEPAKVQTFDEMFPDGLGACEKKAVVKPDGEKPINLATELAISKAVEARLAEARKARLGEYTTFVRPDFDTYRRRLQEKAEQKAYESWLNDMTVLSENSTMFRVLLRNEQYCGAHGGHRLSTGWADSETYEEDFEDEMDDNGEFYEEEDDENSVSDSFEDGGKRR